MSDNNITNNKIVNNVRHPLRPEYIRVGTKRRREVSNI